jgi:hypothetical protein
MSPVASKKLSRQQPLLIAGSASNSRVLGGAVLTKASAIAKDPVKAKDFLQRAGIITKSGKLTANYK